jgi:hypothetical protein
MENATRSWKEKEENVRQAQNRQKNLPNAKNSEI